MPDEKGYQDRIAALLSQYDKAEARIVELEAENAELRKERVAALAQLAEQEIDLCELRTWITAATFYYPDKFPLSCNRERFERAMSPHPVPEQQNEQPPEDSE